MQAQDILDDIASGKSTVLQCRTEFVVQDVQDDIMFLNETLLINHNGLLLTCSNSTNGNDEESYFFNGGTNGVTLCVLQTVRL